MRNTIINAVAEVANDLDDLIMQRIGAEPCPPGMRPVVVFVGRDRKTLHTYDAHGDLVQLGVLTNKQARAVNK